MPSSGSHRVLAHRDILDIIFEQLSTFPRPLATFKDHHAIRTSADAQENRRSLASAACVNKAFLEPASLALWRVMPHGIIPLLRIFKNLRRRSFEKAEWGGAEAYKEYEYELVGEITEEEWQRFDQLAARVWVLMWDIHLGPLVLQAAITRYRGRCASILPNLKLLSWQDSNGDVMQQCLLQLLSAQSLQYLHFFRDDWQWPPGDLTPPALVEDLSVAADVVPRIPHLYIYTTAKLTNGSPLTKFRSIGTLRLYADIGEALYQHLATLPHLEHLHVTGSTIPDGAASESSYRHGFPVLRTLELCDSCFPPPYMKVISRITSPSLTSLSLLLSVVQHVDCVSLIQQMCSLPALQQLVRLHLRVIRTSVPSQSEALDLKPLAFGEVMDPLLGLRRLEDLCLLSNPWAFSVSDYDVLRIQRAWPCLHQLVFEWYSHSGYYSPSGYIALDPSPVVRPSLRALMVLADSCPALEKLFVEVADITNGDMDRAEAYLCEEETRFSQKSLRQFLIGRFDGSPVGLPDDLDRLVKALRQAFPKIGGVGAHHDVPGRLGELVKKLREN